VEKYGRSTVYGLWDKSKYFKFCFFLEALDDFPTKPGKSE
jgi:hypothetical protein